jgi:hypothetical protein
MLRRLAVLILLPVAGALVSCALRQVDVRHMSPGGQEDLVPLAGRTPPLRIDLNSPKPFTREGIPWDDADVVGLDIVWLVPREQRCTAPPYVLVINEYTKAKSLLCVVSDRGEVLASNSQLGLIQKVRLARIAPIPNTQFLVYANPDHGSGACSGDIVLLALSQAELRELLRVPRYEQTSLGGDNIHVSLPLLVRGDGTTRVAVPVFTVSVSNEADAPPSFRTSLSWSYHEYEWDAQRLQFQPASVKQVSELLGRDAWQWLPDYDQGIALEAASNLPN